MRRLCLRAVGRIRIGNMQRKVIARMRLESVDRINALRRLAIAAGAFRPDRIGAKRDWISFQHDAVFEQLELTCRFQHQNLVGFEWGHREGGWRSLGRSRAFHTNRDAEKCRKSGCRHGEARRRAQADAMSGLVTNHGMNDPDEKRGLFELRRYKKRLGASNDGTMA